MLNKSFVLLVALSLAFTGVLAASTKICPLTGPVTPESYTWDFPAEVTGTLVNIEAQAREIKHEASTLQMMARVPGLYSPVSHAYHLTLARERINRIGDWLCRLQEVRRVAAPWQQETIDQIRLTLTALVNDAEAAIEYLNGRNHDTELAMEIYNEYLAGIHRQADALCHCGDVTWARDVIEERR